MGVEGENKRNRKYKLHNIYVLWKDIRGRYTHPSQRQHVLYKDTFSFVAHYNSTHCQTTLNELFPEYRWKIRKAWLVFNDLPLTYLSVGRVLAFNMQYAYDSDCSILQRPPLSDEEGKPTQFLWIGMHLLAFKQQCVVCFISHCLKHYN